MISLREPVSVQIHHRETRTFGGVQIKGQFQLRRWDNCYPDRLFLSASNVALRLPNKRNGTPRKERMDCFVASLLIAMAISPRHSGMRLLAQARNPYTRSWLWILRCAIAHRSSRCARPGMTMENVARTFAFTRRDAPEFCKIVPPFK
jgi:hypothetical protein